MKALRILVVDDHHLVREGLRTLLEGQNQWHVCGEASSGREAVRKALRTKPNLVIMDISMPEMDGLGATRKILEALPGTEVLILTMHESEPMLREALACGARGCVLKSDVTRDLASAVKALSRHRPFFSAKVSEMVLQDYRTKSSTPSESTGPHNRLTPREREVLRLIAAGKTTKEAAAELGVSVKTAEAHRTNIMRKFDVHSVGELLTYAIRNKLAEP